MRIAVVIPAYRPDPELVQLINSLGQSPVVSSIVVIDDGSGPEYASLFEQAASLPRVSLQRHGINLGKGAALKTGLNYVLSNLPDCPGVVTADADGQHRVDDIIRVAERFLAEPDCLVLGSRHFEGPVPWRNRIGNRITGTVFRWLVGKRLRDTQTGLRGIPRSLWPTLLKIPSVGYEFELDMLIAAKHGGVRIAEEKIETVYAPGNPSSHFNPLFDSLRVYFVLLRFTCISLVTALLDNAVFFLTFYATASPIKAQIFGRIVAVLFNYPAARKAVFLSGETHRRLLPRYLLLVLALATTSYALTQFFLSYATSSVILAKLLSETFLFLFNFAVQRDLIFTRSPAVHALLRINRPGIKVSFQPKREQKTHEAKTIH